MEHHNAEKRREHEFELNLVADFNPQPDPPGRPKPVEEFNPQPDPPGRQHPTEDFNPQPDPPGKHIE